MENFEKNLEFLFAISSPVQRVDTSRATSIAPGYLDSL